MTPRGSSTAFQKLREASGDFPNHLMSPDDHLMGVVLMLTHHLTQQLPLGGTDKLLPHAARRGHDSTRNWPLAGIQGRTRLAHVSGSGGPDQESTPLATNPDPGEGHDLTMSRCH